MHSKQIGRTGRPMGWRIEVGLCIMIYIANYVEFHKARDMFPFVSYADDATLTSQ